LLLDNLNFYSHRGEEVKTLLDRAIVIEGSPSRITKDIKTGKGLSHEEFQSEISQIKFKKNEQEI